jgi:RHH-type proline utilization regulon transcriptional repressor/proline dehydrogenase/delta 1-pyrroline-5-carboxylate dehydrogenase
VPRLERLEALIASAPGLSDSERELLIRRLGSYRASALALGALALPGPTGESNVLEFKPRGRIACIAGTALDLWHQAIAALSAGNTLVLARDAHSLRLRAALGEDACTIVGDVLDADFEALLVCVPEGRAREIRVALAARPGKIVPLRAPENNGCYDLLRLVTERTLTVNTAAAGGNASLVSLDESGREPAGS